MSGTCTIRDLPAELLIEIFGIVAHLSRKTTSPTTWMRLLLVCKHWCKLACDTPALWTIIDVSSNLNWLHVCLLRTARLRVGLRFVGLSADTLRAAIPVLVPHAKRIRALKLDGRQRILNFFLENLLPTVSLPVLEELSVAPVENRSREEVLCLQLTHKEYPRLSKLTMSGVSIPRDPAFYRNMRTLHLHENCCTANSFTFQDLVAVLTATTQLEDLDLSRFSPDESQLTPALRDTVHAPVKVVLPKLRSFYMEHFFPFASQLKKVLVLPESSTLYLSIYLAREDRHLYAHSKTVLEEIVPQGARSVIDNARELVLTITQDQFCIRVPNQDRHRPDRVFVDIDGWEGPGLRGLPTMCSLGQLRKLTFSPLPPYFYSTNAWRVFFGACPLLESLALVNCYGSTRRLMEALMPAPGSDIVACPSLRVLRVKGKQKGKLFFSKVAECLAARAQCNTRLNELYLHCLSGLVHEERGKFVQHLHTVIRPLVVGKVEFH